MTNHIEVTNFQSCIVLHVILSGLNEDETLILMNVLEDKISNISGYFITIYGYEGFLVTPKSKLRAKELIKFVDSTKQSKGTIAYGASYFVRLIGALIRPSTVFTTTKEQAFKYMKERCS